MTLRPALFVSGASAGVTAPQDARLALASLLTGPGVIQGGVVTGSSSGPNMKYTIAAGAFATQRGTLATDGLYVVPNDGPVTVDSGAPAPTSGTRWDLVWVRQLNAYGSDGFGDANSLPTFGVTVGTAGSTPSKPYASVPAGALVLAESNVGTNIANAAAATITNVAAPVGPRITPLRIQYHTTASQTLTSAVDNIINTWTKDVDNIGATSGMGASAWVVPTGFGGQYKLSATVSVNNGSATFFNFSIRINGAALAVIRQPAGSTITSMVIPPIETHLNDGDSVTITVYAQGTGSSTANTFGVFLRAEKVT